MLSRFLRWIFGRRDPDRMDPGTTPDLIGLHVMREQRRIAERVSRLPGVNKTPEQLLDYRRADGLLTRSRK